MIFEPENEAQEIAQNIRTIVAVKRGTVPYYRNFGVSVSALDMPIVAASRYLKSEMMAAIQAFEPRASMDTISAEINLLDGILTEEVKTK